VIEPTSFSAQVARRPATARLGALAENHQRKARPTEMPNFAFLLAVVAAILIVYGRMARRNRVAIGGFAALALAAVVYLLTRG
jgi:hypothetical protein